MNKLMIAAAASCLMVMPAAAQDASMSSEETKLYISECGKITDAILVGAQGQGGRISNRMSVAAREKFGWDDRQYGDFLSICMAYSGGVVRGLREAKGYL